MEYNQSCMWLKIPQEQWLKFVTEEEYKVLEQFGFDRTRGLNLLFDRETQRFIHQWDRMSDFATMLGESDSCSSWEMLCNLDGIGPWWQ